MKKLIAAIVPLLALGMAPAASASPLSDLAALKSPLPAVSASASRLTLIQQRGDKDISDRQASLSGLIAKVQSLTHLTADQKGALVSDLQGQNDQLTALKGKLDADETADGAKADFGTIFSQHFVYAFYIPRIERLVAADREYDAATALLGVADKLQPYVATAQQQGVDVTAMQGSLADLRSKAQDAKAQAQGVLDDLIPLTASGYPGNKGVIEGANADLKTGRSDLADARRDAGDILTALRKNLSNVQ